MYIIAAHLDRNAIIHDIKVFFNFFPFIFSVGQEIIKCKILCKKIWLFESKE